MASFRFKADTMASPQIENGHIDIATTIVDKFCSYRLNGQEWQIIWVILRKTWGWLENPKDRNSPKKKMDRIALSQFAKLTGIDRCRCYAVLKGLIVKKIIKKSVVKKFNTLHITYGFQKNFDKWLVLPKSSHTKDTLKETITKETSLPDSIEYRLANYLLKFILKRNPNHKKPNIQSWTKHIDLMLRIDNRNIEDVRAVIKWCQVDSFWQNNILSTKKLREKFDQLYLKMQEFNPKTGSWQTDANLKAAKAFLERDEDE